MADHFMKLEADRQAQKAHESQMRDRLRKELDEWTPRARRAHNVANQMVATLRKFIPDACMADAFQEAMLTAFMSDVEIVPVPPERDAMDKQKLDAASVLAPKVVISSSGSMTVVPNS